MSGADPLSLPSALGWRGLISQGKSWTCFLSCPRYSPPSFQGALLFPHAIHFCSSCTRKTLQSINTLRTAWLQRCPTYVTQKKGIQGLLNLKLVSATPRVTQFLLEAGLHVLCLSFLTITIVHSCIIINSYWKDILENVALCNHI